MLKQMLKTNEFLVALTIVVLSLVIGLISPAYFTVANLFDLLRSATVTGMLALGVLIVIISGQIDVSFTAITAFSMYVTVKILNAIGFNGTVLVAFLISAPIGLGLGLINAAIISRFKLPTLIVTLGTQTLFRGFLLFFIGSNLIRDIPGGMEAFWKANLVTLTTPEGALTHLHSSILLLVAAALVTWFLLKYTMLGRGIYALGGAPEAAERAGFSINGIQMFIYGYVGFLAGIAGVAYGSLNRQADPTRLVGSELDVIAAVVLGGAIITGGRGSVIGTLLGVFLITIVNNSLILMGIPSIWQKVVIGLIIIIGTGLPAYQNRRAAGRLSANLAE
jgi:simple sugar transport system permease protein